jgi:hypothetical protein
MELTDLFKEDLRNHFDDGYKLGREDERVRCMTMVKLDMMLSEETKQRVLDLLRGGKENND